MFDQISKENDLHILYRGIKCVKSEIKSYVYAIMLRRDRSSHLIIHLIVLFQIDFVIV